MCPLSDDALLEWALSPGEAEPELVSHLRDCRPCRERSEAVLREQDLLREALAAPATRSSAPSRGPAPARGGWSRLGIAALLLVSLCVGLLLARSAGAGPLARLRGGSTYRHAALAPIQSDLGAVAEKIAAARETLPEREDHRSASAYLDLLSQEEGLYLSGMQHYLSENSPLSETQEQGLRQVVQEFYASLGSRELAERSQGLLNRLHELLNDDQFRAFEEFSRQGIEWQWKTAIALLTNDLSGELDLRFSEAERVRHALESNYPKENVPVLLVNCCPPDPLVDNPTLTGAVRNSLDPTYQRKFDSYLGHVKTARERALKIVRHQKSE